MKTKLSTHATKLTYWISALLIALLTASTYTFTGFASPIAQTGLTGFGGSTSQGIIKAQVTGYAGVESVILPTITVSPDASSENTVEPIVTAVPTAVPVITEVVSSSFISLADFSSQVSIGGGSQVTGLYSENNFALTVIQQPSGQAGFVSTNENTATQFNMAAGLGFLAHNYLAGSNFSSLSNGMTISVVFGDGNSRNYRVSNIRKFQALDPDSPYSNFIDLASGEQLSASDLFYQTYGISGQMVLQTCINSDGNSSWGRLFIIATPEN